MTPNTTTEGCDWDKIIMGVDPGTNVMGYGILGIKGKKAEMIAMKELLGATGYIRGGCSPIGMKKPLPTFFDSSALRHDFIFVSAGVRGMQLRMHPQELIDFTGATTTSLVKDNDDE